MHIQSKWAKSVLHKQQRLTNANNSLALLVHIFLLDIDSVTLVKLFYLSVSIEASHPLVVSSFSITEACSSILASKAAKAASPVCCRLQ